jgi:hypothetical protein
MTSCLKEREARPGDKEIDAGCASALNAGQEVSGFSQHRLGGHPTAGPVSDGATTFQVVRLAAIEERHQCIEERNAALSPDGRWLAYEAESTAVPGRLDIHVRPFPDVNRGLWQVTSEGGTFPLWSRDGRELYHLTLDNAVVAVPVEGSATTWRAGIPTTLFGREYFVRDGSLGRQYDVAPDGRFLMLKREAGTEPPHFVIVQNWVTELAQQVRRSDRAGRQRRAAPKVPGAGSVSAPELASHSRARAADSSTRRD